MYNSNNLVNENFFRKPFADDLNKIDPFFQVR
jgi:hypothetical protein